MNLEAVDPTTGTVVASYLVMTTEDVDAALDAAVEAQRAWASTSLEDRAERLRAVATELEAQADHLARLMAREMGKPLAEGRSEVEKCAWVCRHYAAHGADDLADEPVSTDAAESFVAYRPVGLVLAVMPWNFPFWQVFRFAAPTLMAGNGAVLKHAENVPGCARSIEGLFRDAGWPRDLFRTVLVDKSHVADLLADTRIRAATLTGSTRAGRAVAREAGAQLKPTVLELGGSDPYLVLADADLDLAASLGATSRLINGGQSCIAAKRFVVVEHVRDAFTSRLVAAMSQARMGNPLDPETTIGPLARRDLRDTLHAQVEQSVSAGARCLMGGVVPDGPGAFYPPTVLTDVAPGMPAYDEELFGPVASIVPVADEDEAVRVANDTPYGLGAAVFTRDVARGRRLAVERLDAGCCAVNDFVRSDPRLPFGGVKDSGYGRELARPGIRAFVNVKAISIR